MSSESRKLSSHLPPALRPFARRLGLEKSRARLALRDALLRARLAVGGGIEHVQGPREIDLGEDELVVLCMVRNGAPWLPTYLRHYRDLGARHFVFLDNGSDDATVEIASSAEDSSVFRTPLPYEPYFVVLKRWLVRRFGRGCWSLVADADELFDYPFSGRLGLAGFLAYLNRNRYTAVPAQNLEMVSDEPLADLQGREESRLDWAYRFYDTSAITRSKEKYWLRLNETDTGEHRSHSGGIRQSAFGWSGSMLTKLPLVRHDGSVDLFPYDGHFVTGARVADVSGVFLHYKFTSFFYEHMREEIEREAHYDDARIFKRYARVLKENPDLNLRGPHAREYRSAEDLLGDGFLIASEEYREWVRRRGGGAAGPEAAVR